MANLESAFSEPLLDNITIIHLATSSIETEDIVQIESQGYNWSSDISNYIMHDQLPKDKIEAQKIKFKASMYTVIKDRLYRRLSIELTLYVSSEKIKS